MDNSGEALEERAIIVAWLESECRKRGKKTQDGWALHWAAWQIAQGYHKEKDEE